jgi:hypothetical protein
VDVPHSLKLIIANRLLHPTSDMIANSCFHRGGLLATMVNPTNVVVHVMERDCVLQTLKLFRECIGQSGKQMHRHTHRQILTLNVVYGDVIVIGFRSIGIRAALLTNAPSCIKNPCDSRKRL